MDSYIPALTTIREELTRLIEQANAAKITDFAEKLIARAEQAELAASGSWRGKHANVYYVDLQAPPPSESYLYFKEIKQPYFDTVAIGLMRQPQHETQASIRPENWRLFKSESIFDHIVQDVDVELLATIARECERLFHDKKDRVISGLRLAGRLHGDQLLTDLADEIDGLHIATQTEVIEEQKAKHSNPKIKSNKVADNEVRIPPHIELYAKASWTIDAVVKLKKLEMTTETAIDHLSGLQGLVKDDPSKTEPSGHKIFVGYGHSNAWRRLTEFLEHELSLDPVFFNRGSAVGKIGFDRLMEMVNDAGIAILVMTGDDKLKNGKLHPRLNVVHEAGLFHSRLGNERVIILLEEGCEKFSNIDGITYIPFPKTKISETFKEIEETLRREGILEPEP